MPKRTAATDRRGHGIGDNVSGRVAGKSNLQDGRTKGAYAPKAPAAQGASAGAEFRSGAAAARGDSTKPPTRAVPKVNKIGG